MTKKDKPQAHIELGDDLHSKLLLYKSKRPKATKTSVIVEALELLFAQQDVEPKKDKAISLAIETYFDVPISIPKKSFYSFLYMLSKKVPDMGTVVFWGKMIYKGDDSFTNKQVFDLITEQISKSFRK